MTRTDAHKNALLFNVVGFSNDVRQVSRQAHRRLFSQVVDSLLTSGRDNDVTNVTALIEHGHQHTYLSAYLSSAGAGAGEVPDQVTRYYCVR